MSAWLLNNFIWNKLLFWHYCLFLSLSLNTFQVNVYNYEAVSDTIDVSFRGQCVDWELIIMKNTEDCQHLLLYSPQAQEKQGMQSTQAHIGEHSVHTCTHTNCTTHPQLSLCYFCMMQRSGPRGEKPCTSDTKYSPKWNYNLWNPLRGSEVIDGGSGISLLTDVGSKPLVYSLILRKTFLPLYT